MSSLYAAVMVGAIYDRSESLGTEQTWASSRRMKIEKRIRLSEEQTQILCIEFYLEEMKCLS